MPPPEKTIICKDEITKDFLNPLEKYFNNWGNNSNNFLFSNPKKIKFCKFIITIKFY
jgi:hypothetical protein